MWPQKVYEKKKLKTFIPSLKAETFFDQKKKRLKRLLV